LSVLLRFTDSGYPLVSSNYSYCLSFRSSFVHPLLFSIEFVLLNL